MTFRLMEERRDDGTRNDRHIVSRSCHTSMYNTEKAAVAGGHARRRLKIGEVDTAMGHQFCYMSETLVV